MSAAIAFWRAEHANFAHMLDLFDSKLAALHQEAVPDYGVMLDIVDYLRHFPDRYHHRREDVAFACLARRDPALIPLVERLQTEHRQLAAAGDALRYLLENALEDAVLPRKSIEAAGADYLVLYRQHIASEEISVMPHAIELMTPADWQEVARVVPQGIDPLFGAEAEEGYRELRRLIAMQAG